MMAIQRNGFVALLASRAPGNDKLHHDQAPQLCAPASLRYA
jgi:hypothetical protein